MPVGLADGGGGDAGRDVLQRHRGAGHGGTLGVRDSAQHGGGIELGVRGSRHQQGDGKEPERQQPALSSQHGVLPGLRTDVASYPRATDYGPDVKPR